MTALLLVCADFRTKESTDGSCADNTAAMTIVVAVMPIIDFMVVETISYQAVLVLLLLYRIIKCSELFVLLLFLILWLDEDGVVCCDCEQQ